MNQAPDNSWGIPRRQARAGLVIILFKATVTILKTLWPLVLLLLVKKNRKGLDEYEIAILALPVIILIRSLVEYFYFRFFIANEELIIRKGFISKKTITIPLQKIQAVHIEQNLLHQLANVAKVKIDTAGTEKTEAVIDAIEVHLAEELKAFLLKERGKATEEGPAPSAAPDIPVMRLSFTDLLRLGISANHIQAFFVVLAFSISSLQNLEEIFGDRVIRIVKDSSTQVGVSVVSIALITAFVLIISVMVSMIRIFLTYFDFELTETGKGFKVKSGLINTKQFLVPFSKVQYISWEANWIRRKIGLFNLEFHQVMGHSQSNRKQRVKVPLTNAGFISGLLSHYHPLVAPHALNHFRIHPAYTFRRTLLTAVLPVTVLLSILLLIRWNPWYFLMVLYIPFTAWQAVLFRKNFRLYIAADALQIDSGSWGRRTQVVKWYKFQQVTIQQSIYQRHHALATLTISTAGGTITIPYIPFELARQLHDYAMFEIERSDRPWM